MSVLINMLDRIRIESETKTSVEVTAYEALVIDAKFFELKQLVDDQRRLIDFLRVDEKAKERAAVVAWLRAKANAAHPSELDAPALSPSGRGLLLLAADCIERNDHRKEVE